MDYKKQTFEWSFRVGDVPEGEPVGFEAVLSPHQSFFQKTFYLNTFSEVSGGPQGRFYYSLDNGENWTNYPIGDTGQIFTQDFKIRLDILISDSKYVFLIKNGLIHKLAGHGSDIISSLDLKDEGLNNGQVHKDMLYLHGEISTLKKINYKNSEYKLTENSINLKNIPLDVSIDFGRKVIYQINNETVEIKTINGALVKKFDIANYLQDYSLEIEKDYSSSSSSSSSSNSSSSSEGFSSSSSSSFDFVVDQRAICVENSGSVDGAFDAFIGQYHYVGRGYNPGLPDAPSYLSEDGLSRIGFDGNINQDGVYSGGGTASWYIGPSSSTSLSTSYADQEALLGFAGPNGAYSDALADYLFLGTYC